MANFVIPSGTVQFTPTGGTAIAIGETPEMTLTVEIKKQSVFTSDGPIAERALSVVTQVDRTGKFSTADIVPSMLALFIVGTNATGTVTSDDEAVLSGELVFTENNTAGSNKVWTFHLVELSPDGDIILKGRGEQQKIGFAFEVVKPASGPLVTIAPAT